jgi:hypothetical protein
MRQGALDHLPDVDDRLIDRPALQALGGRHRVLRVHEGHMNLLFRQAFQLGLEIGGGIRSRPEHRLRAARLGKEARREGSDQRNQRSRMGPDPVYFLQGLRFGFKDAGQCPESLQELLR